MSRDGEVVVISVERGDKYNESTGDGAVAFVNRSIVFAPRGAKPGRQARVILRVLRDGAGNERLDRGGRPMYRADRASVEYIDRWRENPDGTLTRATFVIDWLLQESEEGVCETRAAATREVPGPVTTKWQIGWGSSLADSYLERTVEKTFVTEIESVHEGKLTWKRQSERRVTGAGEMLLVTSVAPTSSYWRPSGLPAEYPDTTMVSLGFVVDDGGNALSVTQSDAWGNLPTWFRDELLVDYPLCGCGRRRLDRKNPPSDGYAKCTVCRDEEACRRCRREPDEQPLQVELVEGRLVCPACVRMTELEAIAERIPAEKREAVAAQAADLLARRALPREVGECLLDLGLEHVSSSYQHDRIVAERAGFPWYYAAEDGSIAGSKFAPEALEILTLYAKAKGDGLVCLSAWLAGGPRKAADCEASDFYWRSQVKGETVEPTRDNIPVGDDKAFVIAKNLRGAEADRTAALKGYEHLVETLGENASETTAVRDVLQGIEQDYTSALQLVRQAEAAVERKLVEDRRRVAITADLHALLRKHYPACPFCRQPISWDGLDLDQLRDGMLIRACSCLDTETENFPTRKALNAGWGAVESNIDGRTAKVLRRTVAGEQRTVIAELVSYYKYGRWNQVLVLNIDAFGAGEWRTSDTWRPPTARELDLRELERLETTYTGDAARAEEEEGILKLSFHRKTEDRTGDLEWISGDRSDGLLYVAERRRYDNLREGKPYYCHVVRILFEGRGLKIVLVDPYLLADLDIAAEKGRLQGEIERERATPAAVQATVDQLSARFGGNKTKKRR